MPEGSDFTSDVLTLRWHGMAPLCIQAIIAIADHWLNYGGDASPNHPTNYRGTLAKQRSFLPLATTSCAMFIIVELILFFFHEWLIEPDTVFVKFQSRILLLSCIASNDPLLAPPSIQ
jgi:hypothetical protein